MEREVPKTSLAAYKSVKESDMRETHWAKIKEALGKIKVGNYEQIASVAGMDKVSVNRRLSELFRREMVYKAGYTLPTSTNRQAECYQLMPSITQTEKIPEGKTIVDFSKELIQSDLFGNIIT